MPGALNIARFIRSQRLKLLENSTNWTRMNQIISADHSTIRADNQYYATKKHQNRAWMRF
ncbi:TPA: Rop family plasmid primer RNA-binding protein [Escherichia coli]|nr:Rop family plasmid primer RNA-binding protein [Escherichia coli]HAL7767935.1 Rop family plasmid primer RNA-binding protein [Escherichia coli]HBZ8281130.1 Rop family plasmid primer RNA-binding protein [Escherichia coli]HDJ8694505.1 Rop family plasmid primer RNA-binding protein [Escherichia coli]HEI2483010.1 Rop family plasmid primer RNA-binding protein [Escherichia coli]